MVSTGGPPGAVGWVGAVVARQAHRPARTAERGAAACASTPGSAPHGPAIGDGVGLLGPARVRHIFGWRYGAMIAQRVIAGGLLTIAAASWSPGRAGAAAELDCLIQPRETVVVGTPVEGIVQQVAVDRGSVVQTGAVLAVLE